jgi:hypothetical protein
MKRNKLTIKQVDERLGAQHRALVRTVKRIDEVRTLRRKLVTGKIKHPPPKGVKTLFETLKAQRNEFDDILPSFGLEPGRLT